MTLTPDLRYPIGRFEPGPAPDPWQRCALVVQLSEIPTQMKMAVAALSDNQLDTPYREGGWTARQVVHHLADAQLNWYTRTKLALTEDLPQIKPFDEALWAELHDGKAGPIEPSLILLQGITQRWAELFNSLTEDQWMRQMVHPERGVLIIANTLPMHVWHGHHHTAHVTELRKRMGW